MTYNPPPMEHNVHVDPGHRYGCYNRDTANVVEYKMQGGWTEDGRRRMIKHKTEWLPNGCGHSYRSTDPACTGCKWR